MKKNTKYWGPIVELDMGNIPNLAKCYKVKAPKEMRLNPKIRWRNLP
jgi:hypothetical protein